MLENYQLSHSNQIFTPFGYTTLPLYFTASYNGKLVRIKPRVGTLKKGSYKYEKE